jgi:hypothetical protein
MRENIICQNLNVRKTTKIDRGAYQIEDLELCFKLFGSGGTSKDKRWFYRLIEVTTWRRKGTRGGYREYELHLFFRDDKDATLFLLKA